MRAGLLWALMFVLSASVFMAAAQSAQVSLPLAAQAHNPHSKSQAPEHSTRHLADAHAHVGGLARDERVAPATLRHTPVTHYRDTVGISEVRRLEGSANRQRWQGAPPFLRDKCCIEVVQWPVRCTKLGILCGGCCEQCDCATHCHRRLQWPGGSRTYPGDCHCSRSAVRLCSNLQQLPTGHFCLHSGHHQGQHPVRHHLGSPGHLLFNYRR
ncbi:hypothetical protein V8C86DRAFT_2858958 [Haematococcus lacustris]